MKWMLALGMIVSLFSCTERASQQLLWSDEFEGSALNGAYWNYKLGDGCPTLCGWGNNEPQIYTKENAQVSEGT